MRVSVSEAERGWLPLCDEEKAALIVGVDRSEAVGVTNCVRVIDAEPVHSALADGDASTVNVSDSVSVVNREGDSVSNSVEVMDLVNVVVPAVSVISRDSLDVRVADAARLSVPELKSDGDAPVVVSVVLRVPDNLTVLLRDVPPDNVDDEDMVEDAEPLAVAEIVPLPTVSLTAAELDEVAVADMDPVAEWLILDVRE